MPSKRSQPKREFTVVIEKGDDGYFFAYVPELRACQTQAKSMDKLMVRIREAIELCLEVEQMDEEDGRSEFVGIQKVAV
ncbi:MAG: type II toxin-antitoxin system HicB family antitoxin, partial [Phycisphaerales bacterium]|nr:type II toxin-antitoxin system HicB family antitoxin [Phycisphaerales bacterium]